MVAQAFLRQPRHPARPVVLIAVSIGNLYALEKLHGRAALNHALFVCASRLRRCVPADMEMGRLFDDGFLLVARNATDLDRLSSWAGELAAAAVAARDAAHPARVKRRRPRPPGPPRSVWDCWPPRADAKPPQSVAMVRDMSRTAWSLCEPRRLARPGFGP